MASPVVGASIGVFDRVSQLVLDKVRAKPEFFIEDRTSHRPESMPSMRLTIEAQAPQSSIDGIFAHWALPGPDARKNVFATACDLMLLPQDRQRLSGKWNKVLDTHLHPDSRDRPLGGFQVNFGPFSMPELSGSHKDKRGKLQSGASVDVTVILVYG